MIECALSVEALTLPRRLLVCRQGWLQKRGLSVVSRYSKFWFELVPCGDSYNHVSRADCAACGRHRSDGSAICSKCCRIVCQSCQESQQAQMGGSEADAAMVAEEGTGRWQCVDKGACRKRAEDLPRLVYYKAKPQLGKPQQEAPVGQVVLALMKTAKPHPQDRKAFVVKLPSMTYRFKTLGKAKACADDAMDWVVAIQNACRDAREGASKAAAHHRRWRRYSVVAAALANAALDEAPLPADDTPPGTDAGSAPRATPVDAYGFSPPPSPMPGAGGDLQSPLAPSPPLPSPPPFSSTPPPPPL